MLSLAVRLGILMSSRADRYKDTTDDVDGAEYDFTQPVLRRHLRFAGVTFLVMGLVFCAAALFVIFMTLTGRSKLSWDQNGGVTMAVIAFGAPFAVAGALMLALPSHPNLARRASAALVVVAVAMVVTCAAVTRMSGRFMGMSVVGGLSSVGIMRSLVSQGKVR